MNKTFDENGNIVIETPDLQYRKAIFLWKRDQSQNWDDLLNLSIEDLTKRVDEIIAAEKKAKKSGAKVPKIDEIIKMDEFREWAKSNEKYISFVTRVQKAKNDPTVGDDEMKKLKAESAPLIKELAKEYKKVLAAA